MQIFDEENVQILSKHFLGIGYSFWSMVNITDNG